MVYYEVIAGTEVGKRGRVYYKGRSRRRAMKIAKRLFKKGFVGVVNKVFKNVSRGKSFSILFGKKR